MSLLIAGGTEGLRRRAGCAGAGSRSCVDLALPLLLSLCGSGTALDLLERRHLSGRFSSELSDSCGSCITAAGPDLKLKPKSTSLIGDTELVSLELCRGLSGLVFTVGAGAVRRCAP